MIKRDPEEVLRVVVNLVAQRDFFRTVEHKQNVLDCLARVLVDAGYTTTVDAF